jgi:hypothetical protein
MSATVSVLLPTTTVRNVDGEEPLPTVKRSFVSWEDFSPTGTDDDAWYDGNDW